MEGRRGEDGLFVLLPKKPRESNLNIWCSWFWRGGISQHPPHSLMSVRLPDSPCFHSHQWYFLFFFRPEIACMTFWQAWQHHVSSKAFQHKQEKVTKNGKGVLFCDSLKSNLYAALYSGLANSSNFYAKTKLSGLWPSALQNVGRVLDSLFDSPPLEIARTALQIEFNSRGW